MKFLKVYSDITRDKDKEEFAMRIWITGDTHGMFERIEKFCKVYQTTKEDLLIIAGDAGINYNGFVKDRPKKEYLEALPIRFLCVHGNHEMNPEYMPNMRTICFAKGMTYYEKEYPNILYAKDGEIYDINGLKTIVLGGAYSVDKYYRLLKGWSWFKDEQPDEKIKEYVLSKNLTYYIVWQLSQAVRHGSATP